MTEQSIKKRYTFHSDPGHGWLAVNISDLNKLQITDKISQYSYVRGNTIYLEEDADYSLFLEATRNAGWELLISVKNSDNRSSIRSYNRFSNKHFHMINKIAVDTEILLYNSNTKQHSTKAKITSIDGTKVYIVDEFNNSYKPLSKERLINCCQFIDL